MMEFLPAQSWLAGGSDLVVRWLAVIGGAALGAVLIPWLVGLFLRPYTTRKPPGFATAILRTLSAVACGLLVYIFVFGGGGGGMGGTGGIGLGQGKGTGVPAGTEKAAPRETHRVSPVRDTTLTVAVLGDDALRRITRSESFDPEKRYRPAGSSELLSLVEVKKLIEERYRLGKPVRRLEIVVYRDSPAPDKPQVKNLENWARDRVQDNEKMVVDLLEADKNAPVE